MPTRLCLPLLLALFAPAIGVAVERVDTQTIVPSETFNRMRPQTVSQGPTGLRRIDRMVEPASFKPLVEPKPLSAPSANPASETTSATQHVSTPAEPLPLPEEATQQEPIQASKPTSAKPSDESDRRLFAPSKKTTRTADDASGLAVNPFQSLAEWRPSSKTLTATGGGLAIAVGLLLATTWLIRSCAPKSSRPLPKDVVEVLGRLPLGGKQMTQLIRVGSKLVLVAVTPDGAETLTEVTDPDEVARLIAACDSKSGRGESADFDRLLHEMSDQRTTASFLEERDQDRPPRDGHGFAETAFDPRSLAAAYANTPGGRGDG